MSVVSFSCCSKVIFKFAFYNFVMLVSQKKNHISVFQCPALIEDELQPAVGEM